MLLYYFPKMYNSIHKNSNKVNHTSFSHEDIINIDKNPPVEAQAELAMAEVAECVQE